MSNLLHRVFLQFRRDPLAPLGIFLIIGITVLAVFAQQIAPYGSDEYNLPDQLQAPSAKHLFGTDINGRDVFSRVVFGSRISLRVAVIVPTVALLIGTIIGSIAGFVGGGTDELLMRLVDIFLSLPPLLLAMAVNASLGPGINNAMIAVIISWWPSYARMIRGQVLSVKNNEYVEAARAIGASDERVLLRHILPNCISPIIVQLALDSGAVVLMIAGLSFIGLGAQPPSSEWGAMVTEGRSHLLANWWWPSFPGLAICLLVVGFNLVGDSLLDTLDPRVRSRARSGRGG